MVQLTYVPILRADPTCLLAVARATARAQMAPVVMVDGEDLYQLRTRVSRLRLAGHTISVDVRSPDRSAHLADFARLIEPVEQAGAECRPVITIDDDPDTLRAVGQWASETGRDLVLRLRVFAVGARERLQQAIVLAPSSTRLARSRIHVLLDQADDPSTTIGEPLLELLAENGPWASITVACGSAPAMSSLQRRGTWIRAERRELAIADSLIARQSAGAPLAFADYANRHPLFEANMPHARGNGFRWPTTSSWFLFRESAMSGWPTPESRRIELAGLLNVDAIDVQSPRSWGERSLLKFMRGDAEADQINAWMINHHLELTAQTLAAREAAITTASATG